MEKKVWATSHDGEIEYLSLTNDRLDELLDIFGKFFCSQGNFCKIAGLSKNAEAIREYQQWIIDRAKHGVSLIAIDKNSNKLIGAVINKIVHKSSPEPSTLEKYINTAKQPEVKRLLEVISKAATLLDHFNYNGVDYSFEICNVLVLPEHSNRGIGYKLMELSIKLATLLYKGENVKTSLDNTKLPLGPKPEVVTSVFSSIKTQKIGEKLNFITQKMFSFQELDFRGQPYSSFIEDGSEIVTYSVRKLE